MKKRKKSRYKMILTVLTALAVIYLIALYTVPAMSPLRHGFYPWLFYIVFLLTLICLWSLSGDKQRYLKHGSQDKVDNEEMEITKAALRERSKWRY